MKGGHLAITGEMIKDKDSLQPLRMWAFVVAAVEGLCSPLSPPHDRLIINLE